MTAICVRCNRDCHQRGNEQLCLACGNNMACEVTWHWHRGRKYKVRTWA